MGFWKIFLESSDEEDEEFAEVESDVVDVEGEYDADVVDVQNNNNVSASQPVTGMIMRTTPNLTQGLKTAYKNAPTKGSSNTK